MSSSRSSNTQTQNQTSITQQPQVNINTTGSQAASVYSIGALSGDNNQFSVTNTGIDPRDAAYVLLQQDLAWQNLQQQQATQAGDLLNRVTTGAQNLIGQLATQQTNLIKAITQQTTDAQKMAQAQQQSAQDAAQVTAGQQLPGQSIAKALIWPVALAVAALGAWSFLGAGLRRAA